MEEGVKGYFEFINKIRYANLKTATTPKQYLEMIKSDGYATSNTYINTNMNLVNKYVLTKYDTISISIYYGKYMGSSTKIDEVFKTIGVNSKYIGNKTLRKPIAKANGITNYNGLAEQNLKLIDLAKQGKLRKVD